MTNTETITLSKAEYEALLQEKEDLEDLVAVMEADRLRCTHNLMTSR